MPAHSEQLGLRWFGTRLAAGFLALTAATGCSRPDVPRPRSIAYDFDPLIVVDRHLEGYAWGRPVGTEQKDFGPLIEKLRTTDAETADWLGAGLREITAAPDQAASIASKLRTRLAKLPKKPRADVPASDAKR